MADMQDRWLWGIVGGVLVLVVVAFVLAGRQPAPEYRDGGEPGDVAHDYLLAVQRADYERAWGYVSPAIEGYPETAEVYVHDITRWGNVEMDSESRAMTVDEVTVTGDTAVAQVRETVFREGGLFESTQYSDVFRVWLARAGGAWRITESERYWDECWTRPGRDWCADRRDEPALELIEP
jgi:hypothetical protein